MLRKGLLLLLGGGGVGGMIACQHFLGSNVAVLSLKMDDLLGLIYQTS